jgi:hypothetical protein
MQNYRDEQKFRNFFYKFSDCAKNNHDEIGTYEKEFITFNTHLSNEFWRSADEFIDIMITSNKCFCNPKEIESIWDKFLPNERNFPMQHGDQNFMMLCRALFGPRFSECLPKLYKILSRELYNETNYAEQLRSAIRFAEAERKRMVNDDRSWRSGNVRESRSDGWRHWN